MSKVNSIVAEVLGIPSEQVTGDLTPDAIATWDSLNHLRMITQLEQELEIKLTMSEIQEITSVDALHRVIAVHTDR